MSKQISDNLEGEIDSLVQRLGLPNNFLMEVGLAEECLEICLSKYYFFDVAKDELIDVEKIADRSEVTNNVRSGAKWGSQFSAAFSEQWYICQAFDCLLRCCTGDMDQKMRASFNLGNLLAELRWKRQTKISLMTAVQDAKRKSKAGLVGGNKSRQRRLDNLEALIVELEAFSDVAGRFPEQALFDQAWANAAASIDLPKSKKSREDYGVQLRSDEPFKSRYDAVFGKNT